MSQTTVHDRIRQNPRFAELVGKRTRFAILLSLIVLVPYYAFMMITAFHPTLLGQPVSDGSIVTVGWPLGAALIVGSWLMTGLYVRRANGEFDRLNEQILKESRQ